MQRLLLAASVTCGALLGAPDARAISLDPFPDTLVPPASRGGELHFHDFTFGTDGLIFQVDALLNIAGVDLNGGFEGTAAILGFDATLPIIFEIGFMPVLSGDTTDVTLIYAVTNNTRSPIDDVTFLQFVDADIGANFENEFASVVGMPALGQSFEVNNRNESNLLRNVAFANLRGTRGMGPDEVSVALSFSFPTLEGGETVIIAIMLSEDGDSLGPLAITQSDAVLSDRLTISGAVLVPEPSLLALLAAALIELGGRIAIGRRLSSHRSATDL